MVFFSGTGSQNRGYPQPKREFRLMQDYISWNFFPEGAWIASVEKQELHTLLSDGKLFMRFQRKVWVSSILSHFWWPLSPKGLVYRTALTNFKRNCLCSTASKPRCSETSEPCALSLACFSGNLTIFHRHGNIFDCREILWFFVANMPGNIFFQLFF